MVQSASSYQLDGIYGKSHDKFGNVVSSTREFNGRTTYYVSAIQTIGNHTLI